MANGRWDEDDDRTREHGGRGPSESRGHWQPEPPRDRRGPAAGNGPQAGDERTHDARSQGRGYGYGTAPQHGQQGQQGRYGSEGAGQRPASGSQQGGYGGAGLGGQQGGYGGFGERAPDGAPSLDNGYGGMEYGGGSGYGQPRAYADGERGQGDRGYGARRGPGDDHAYGRRDDGRQHGATDQGGYRGEPAGDSRRGEGYGRFDGPGSYGGYGSPASYGAQGWSQGGSMQARPRRGPKGYTRSDERIRDDICDHLMRSDLDVEDVSVRVEKGHVTLEGTVQHRHVKHRLEDIVDACMGVQDIDNRVRVRRAGDSERGTEAGSPDRPGNSAPDGE